MSDAGNQIKPGSVNPEFTVRYMVANSPSRDNEVCFLIPGEIASHVVMGLQSMNVAFFFKSDELHHWEDSGTWQQISVWHADPAVVLTAYRIFSELVERAWNIVAPK